MVFVTHRCVELGRVGLVGGGRGLVVADGGLGDGGEQPARLGVLAPGQLVRQLGRVGGGAGRGRGGVTRGRGHRQPHGVGRTSEGVWPQLPASVGVTGQGLGGSGGWVGRVGNWLGGS